MKCTNFRVGQDRGWLGNFWMGPGPPGSPIKAATASPTSFPLWLRIFSSKQKKLEKEFIVLENQVLKKYVVQ